ncbi:SusD/RagB family nutrient-binding outer membrane lipoprotein [Mucilaginibacter aquatilis]|uniref:SusD/RagB family nutrient-binding outer membrane lipoprotein n=1 Tax=Mucilaginibacter aquatilis TaxID=1517760 RepID=A0A6I4IQY2_9SPHI|nr:SusD/RagB family nutrient-binding outer membrane lipoprotein [Mucilaginibacter aquatilis]MVN92573.1 SusD/RagB family nutrient-binding outer membrane lipoprotein [Mucilaginibacter aquatilis]
MKKYIYPIFALALLTVTSCKKDFFDINQNPNSPTDESVTPQVILPRALSVTAARIGTNFDYAAFWTGYWSRSGTYGQSIEIESYNITTGFNSGQWTGWYDILTDENIMEKKAVALNQPFYQAAAKTLKAIGFMYLVDQYNNVPYTRAFDIQGSILPSYDKGEDIYADLLVQLDAAAKLFKGISTVDPATQAADVMFSGDVVQWRKLVNTLRLKLLLHESQVVPAATVTNVVSQITADGAGYLAAGESATVNPGYVIAVDQQNPFYNTYKSSALGVLDQYNRANNYILGKYAGADGVVSQNPTNAGDDDPRLRYVFSAAATPTIAGATNYYRGTNFGEVLPNSDPYRAANQSDVAGPGLAKSPTQDQPLLTSIESLFMQAEAQQRGWIPGAAATTYASAITESFSYLGAPGAAAYLTRPGVVFNSTINQIVFQKYLSLIGLDNFEAYVDYRRLGVPTDLPLSANANRLDRVIPLRLQYPQAEYSYNAANVAAQGTINPQTSAIFWDK